jgi:hypothetical protein
MYSIEKKDFGYKLVFGDFIKADEMKKWVEESRKALAAAPKEFGVFVDMRTLRPLPSDSQVSMEEGQKLYKKKGMVRSAVILDSKVITLQFKRIAKETGIYEWERYIDASATPDWEKTGLEWIRDGKDPDKK